MIRFTLQCPGGHRFESWFRDGAAFDAVSAAGGLVCPDCGSTDVEKSLMAPTVRPARANPAPPEAASSGETEATSSGEPEAASSGEPEAASFGEPEAASFGETAPSLAPQNARERALAALRAKVEAEADYVGLSFAREARAIHTGDAPERPIYGEAKPAEAIALIEDGVPVAPLPFAPTRKLN